MKLLICGKGGSGKSTISALLARAMQKRGKKVLLVDSDESNIGLYRMLGLDLSDSLLDSLGGKKGFKEKMQTTGITLGGPPQLFPGKLNLDELPDHCVAESKGIRVMSIGKIHHFGEGCACPMGRLFRMLFSSLIVEEQELVIVDTAAGVEHFGRSLDGVCDHIVCVADPSYESIMMTQKVTKLAKEAGLLVSVILNKVTPEIEDHLDTAFEQVSVIGRLQQDPSIFKHNLEGSPLNMGIPGMGSICSALESMQK